MEISGGVPLISVRGLSRTFAAGDQSITVLQGVDLDVHAGEMIAIIGASGSGKSTLMNILGCLDRPSSGSYHFAGQDVTAMDGDDRARLRRDNFGFIFQRYQLLPDLDARANVEVPAIYRGLARGPRRKRAEALLTQLGLADRLGNRPGQLSGGQQQRVSVARALMNGGDVILADEPTGALDTRSGADLMALLTELNRQGHTVIIVTHDPGVAAQTRRTVEIRDGQIISDTRSPAADPAADPAIAAAPQPAAVLPDPQAMPAARGTGPGIRPGTGTVGALAGRIGEAFTMAFRAMAAHRLRSFLTMLGIIIGIASVVSVVALGQGSQQKVLEQISSIGTNTITVRRGTSFGDRRANAIVTLVPADAEALAAQPYALSASPQVTTSILATYQGISATVSVNGVSAGYFDVNGYTLATGQLFGPDEVARADQVAVLDSAAALTFFPDGSDPLGKVILIKRVPVRVIGTVTTTSSGFGPQTVRVFLPYTTVSGRLTGSSAIESIAVRISDDYTMSRVESLITELLLDRHGRQDFFLLNSDTIRATITSTTQTLTWLVSAIAIISLVVGGIGVMNIMLVSVTERTKEIGVRIAVGARKSDIVMQFLIEAVMVCLMGGALGVMLAWGGGWLATMLQSSFRLNYSSTTALIAFASSSLIGITFGLLPARSAAQLDPVTALARE